MAIASGFSFQRVRTSVTTGVVAASFLFGGVIEEVPPFGSQLVVQAAQHKREAQSFLLPSNLREDITPEVYRHIVHEAERPRIPPQSYLLQSEDIVDITLDIERQVISLEKHPQRVPQSFLHSAPLFNDVDTTGGLTVASAHHRDGVQALQGFIHSTFLADDVGGPDEPERFRQFIAEAPEHKAQPPASFLLESNLREDIQPELYRRIVHEAERPRIPAASFLLQSEDIEDIRLETRRWVITPLEHPRIPPASYLHFEPIDDAPPDPDQFATTRQLVVKALPLTGSPPQSFLHFEPIDDAPVVVELEIKRSVVAEAVSNKLAPPASMTRGEVFKDDIRLSHYRWYQDDNTDEDATTSYAAEDTPITTGLSSASIHLRVKLSNDGFMRNNQTFDLEFDLDDAGSWAAVTAASSFVRYINGQPTGGALTSERLTSTGLVYNDGVYNEAPGIGDTILELNETEYVHSIEIRFADFASQTKVAFRQTSNKGLIVPNTVIPTLFIFQATERKVIVEAEPIADIPPQSFLFSGRFNDVVAPLDEPEIDRYLVTQALSPEKPAASWTHDYVPPDDVVAVDHPSAGLTIRSAHHREAFVQGESVRLTSVVPETENTVRYISITLEEPWQNYPGFTPQSFLRHGIPPPEIVPELYRNIIHKAEPVRMVEQPAVFSFFVPPDDIFPELYRRIVHQAEPITLRVPPNWFVDTIPPDDVVVPLDPDRFIGRHIAPTFD